MLYQTRQVEDLILDLMNNLQSNNHLEQEKNTSNSTSSKSSMEHLLDLVIVFLKQRESYHAI